MSWRRFDALLLLAMVILWVGSALTGLIGNTAFIGHVSMLALVLAALASLRADSPTEEQRPDVDG